MIFGKIHRKYLSVVFYPSWTIRSKLNYAIQKKVYAVANTLVSCLGFHFLGEEEHLFENLVYIELCRYSREIFYLNNGATECDFWVREFFCVTQAIQVCYLRKDLVCASVKLKAC